MKKFLTHINKKWIIQLLIAGIIIYICIEPKIYLHPVMAASLILFCYILHSYIENFFTLKKMTLKREKQDKLITTMCDSSINLIAYKDLQGKYIYCNRSLLKTFNKTMEEIQGKTVYDLLDSQKAKSMDKLTKLALTGKIKKEVLHIGDSYFDCVLTPVVMGDLIIGVLTIGKNITEETRLKNELAKSEKQLNAILNCIPIAVFLKDMAGNIKFENRLSKKYFNLMGQLEPEKSIIQSNENAIQVHEEDTEILKGKHCVQKEMKVRLQNNTEKWFHLNKCPIVNSDEELIGICGVMRDIDIEKIAQEQKETFVATLTHDLKTPTLAQIKAIDLLLSGKDDSFSEEQQELLKLTKESCNYMLDMISTLLCTYKYENSDYVLELDSCDIKNLVEESCSELTALLSENNNTVAIHAQNEQYISICDRMQIKRVITNFLGNAISYAYKNSTIEIDINKIDNNIDVKITSKSTYIDPTVLQNLFKKYVTHAAKYNKIGVGLGLYLSKQIVTAHGGEVYAQSLESNKNIFGFILPVDQ